MRRHLNLKIGLFLGVSSLALVVPVIAPGARGLNMADVASAQQMPTMLSPACLNDGTGCRVGSKGPAGGVVFYDAGSPQWWGRFLEAQLESKPVAHIPNFSHSTSAMNCCNPCQLILYKKDFP